MLVFACSIKLFRVRYSEYHFQHNIAYKGLCWLEFGYLQPYLCLIFIAGVIHSAISGNPVPFKWYWFAMYCEFNHLQGFLQTLRVPYILNKTPNYHGFLLLVMHHNNYFPCFSPCFGFQAI